LDVFDTFSSGKKHTQWISNIKTGVTNVVPAGTRSPARTK